MNVGANNIAAKNNNDTDALGGGKANTMLIVMDLDNYDPSYDGYTFFKPGTITIYSVTTINGPRNTYHESTQVQGSPPSPPYTSGGIVESFNQFNRSICPLR